MLITTQSNIEACNKMNDNDENLFYSSDRSANETTLFSCSCDKIKINVGGSKHEVLWKTFEHLPCTRLGRLRYAQNINEILQLCDYYDEISNEFFFDRHPHSFISILNFYHTGKLHLVDDICLMSFHNDLNYWGINEFYLEICCQNKFQQKKDEVSEEIRKEQKTVIVENEISFTGYFSNSRRKIWDLMERPDTSKASRVSKDFLNIITNRLHD